MLGSAVRVCFVLFLYHRVSDCPFNVISCTWPCKAGLITPSNIPPELGPRHLSDRRSSRFGLCFGAGLRFWNPDWRSVQSLWNDLSGWIHPEPGIPEDYGLGLGLVKKILTEHGGEVVLPALQMMEAPSSLNFEFQNRVSHRAVENTPVLFRSRLYCANKLIPIHFPPLNNHS